MTTQLPNRPYLSVRATKGALAILEKHRDEPRTVLAVTRALFTLEPPWPDKKTSLIIEGGLLSVHYDPGLNLALIVTSGQAWLGIVPALEEALFDVSTDFGVT